jgi:hypothetical protein
MDAPPMDAPHPLAAAEFSLSPHGGNTKRSAWYHAHSVWKYESPLADLEMLESAPEVKRIMNRLPDAVIDWNIPSQLSLWTAGNLSALAAEMPQRSPLRSSGMYPALDVAVLWAMVRSARPRRIIEIGAGTTTTVISAARRANAEQEQLIGVGGSSRASDDGGAALCEAAARVSGGDQSLPRVGSGCHVCVEPFRVAAIAESDVVVLPSRIQTVPLALFDHLGRDDILFIDSSHVLQPYGDTLFELLWILPRLKSGVFVHVHDIFLPFDYPAAWTEAGERQYTEQYVLAALLNGSEDTWEVVFATHMLLRSRPELFREIGLSEDELNGGSLWLRKK